MQYHYVVMFDDEHKSWTVVGDADAYFPDGNVWDDVLADGQGYGWFYPDHDESARALAIDGRCYDMLYTLVSTLPAVDTEA